MEWAVGTDPSLWQASPDEGARTVFPTPDEFLVPGGAVLGGSCVSSSRGNFIILPVSL